MPAYLIVFRETPETDPEAKAEYTRRATGASAGHALKPLAAYGALHPVEGAAPDAVILLEFPDVAAARAWYDSPAYQAAIPLRLKSADYRSVIVEGLPARG